MILPPTLFRGRFIVLGDHGDDGVPGVVSASRSRGKTVGTTNYLIRGLVKGTLESNRLVRWHQTGEPLISAAPAWYKFLCGPVSQPQIRVMHAFLSAGVIAFEEAHAIEAARLFNAIGRIRRSRIDAMMAATAILAGARLATLDKGDFKVFVPHGLKLV